LGSWQGMFQYDPGKDSIRQVSLIGTAGNEIDSSHCKSLIYDSHGVLWMLDWFKGLFWYDAEKEVFRQQHMQIPDFIQGQINYAEMKPGQEGRLWILGAKAELASFNPSDRSLDFVELPHYKTISPTIRGGMAIDKEGKIWFGIDQGLMVYNPESGVLSAANSSSPRPMVSCMLADMQGNILVGSFHGVKMVDMQKSKIRTIPRTKRAPFEGVNWLTTVLRDNQDLWIGSFRAGLTKYNLEKDFSLHYRAEGKPGDLASDRNIKIFRDRDLRIWVMSGWNGNLQRYDPESDSFESFDIYPSFLITQDEDGTFWMLGRDRLVHFDPVGLDTTIINFRKQLPPERLNSQLDHIPFIRDKEGIFWFAQADGGLYRIDPNSRNWTHYNHDPSQADGLPDIHTKALFCDSRGRIWLTSWAGLSRIIPDPVSDTAISFDNSYITELHLGQCIRVTEDKQGNIWAGTFKGVLVLKPDGNIEKYTSKDGLPDNPTMIWALDSDPENGNLYMGSADLAIVPQDYLIYNKYIPPIRFTGFRLGDKHVKPGKGSPLEKSILFADRIDLDHKQNFFYIDFAALNFSHPERNQYRYIMEGVDQDTIYSGNRSFAEYTDLLPGRYTFWATGSNNSGLWNREGRSILIRIHPPWHRTILAFIIYFFVLASLVFAFIRFRTYRLRHEKIRLEQEVENRTLEISRKNQQIIEMENLRTRFFTDISHEIRTPLTLITGPLENLIQEEEQTEKSLKWLNAIKRNSQRLLQLVNQLLDIARLDAKQMKLVLEYSDVLKHLRILANGYHSLAEVSHIRLVLDIPDNEMIQWIDRDKVEKVSANLLTNALKYTPEHGVVTFRVRILTRTPYSMEQPAIRILVADNGPGIPDQEKSKVFDRFFRSEKADTAAGGTGVGLSVTRDMLDLMHGDITLKSMEGKGSVFAVTIPLGKDHLADNEYIIKEAGQPVSVEVETLEPGHQSSTKEIENGKSLSVLLIEDNNEVRSFIKESLETGYIIIEALDGIRGLNMATSEIPDLIITDVMMPGMDGFKLCKKLKTDERTSHIPVIMLTARALDHDRLEGLETGADDYMIKPFRLEELTVRIRNLIEQRERLREKYSAHIKLNLGELTVTTLDDKFLKKVTGIIADNLYDFRFDVGTLQERMNMSSSNLYRKLKVLTGESPVQLLRIMRLKMAASLIKRNNLSITEVMLQVGFSNQSYFSRSFKEFFGETPKAFQKSHRSN